MKNSVLQIGKIKQNTNNSKILKYIFNWECWKDNIHGKYSPNISSYT